ncbi:hypothetical protein NVS89_09385 [Ancylobacter sp. MQZ15Z-1]|uniref:Uncharacterized protein n=1 Tax=Ancylobacter mangrovi TaxID=2972472 RepID=A0A9X2PCA5_9HYPH|nr:hypothetical protein [Ancylobacter mangrovi]MCS0495310.1 hypothetical protein [Ancylobacter mangrovi]
MNIYEAQSRFKSRMTELQRWEENHASPEFVGARYSSPLEATTRKFVIDEVMDGLLWDLSRMTREVVEEARVRGETTLFLDYLGVNPDTRRPWLIVEAKAWAKPMIAWSANGLSSKTVSKNPAEMVAAAINHLKAGKEAKDSPVILEWAQWLEKLRDYVRDLKAESGIAVTRAAITSGRWLVIIKDPQVTLLDDRVAGALEVLVYEGQSLVQSSDAIFDLLSRISLLGDTPEFATPSQAASLITAADVARVFRGVWLARQTTGSQFRPRPLINLYPIIVLDLTTGEKLVVHDESEFALPAKGDAVPKSTAELEAASNALLAQINAVFGAIFTASPLNEFGGFPNRPGDPALSPIRPLSKYANEYMAVTGESAHYLRSAPTIGSCAAHGWGALVPSGVQVGSMVLRSSVDPASYFADGDAFHCAHRVVHERRDRQCFIAPFEKYLCCRACIYQDRCWSPAQLGALPCGLTM